MLRKHILPYFGETKLSDIKPMHIENYGNQKKKEVSNNTVLKHISLIGTILHSACDNELVQSNPVPKIDKTSKDPAQIIIYNADELTHLMSISKGTEIEVPIFFAIMFGLRRSEIVGLRWENINFTKKTLSINGSVTRMCEDGKWYDMYTEKTKTKASKATFYFNDSVCEYIKKIYEHNMNLISNVDDYKEFVCVNEIGERLKVDYITHRFSKLLKQNDLKHIRFHDLRHSVLTLLIHNHSIKDVQGFARHANFQTTADIYCHFDETSTLDELNTICSNLNF